MAHRIAVWDVIGHCQRPGSLDRDISHEVVNPILEFIAQLPELKGLILNGGTAAMLFKKSFPAMSSLYPGLKVVQLPSSSPIPSARYRTWQDKQSEWQQAFREILGIV